MSILLDSPNLGEREKEALARCIDSTYVSTAGPYIEEFETSFAAYVGASCAVAVQSGTAALHIALVELGVGAGDEVILPTLTFAASVNPVLYCGASPVLVDVNPDTWTLDADEVEKAITSRTKAVMPVHLYGNPCDMDSLCSLCAERGIGIIEDATESLGAAWRGQSTGTFGAFGCFSFNGNKLITTGGGGMVVTTDPDHADHIRFLVNQARDASKGYYHPELGYNYRMTNLEASLGLAQLERLDEFLAAKRRFASMYRDALEDLPGVEFQHETPCGESAWWLPSLTVEHPSIPALQKILTDHGVPTRRVFSPLHTFPYLRGHAPFACPNAERIHWQGLNLPASTVNDDASVRSAAEIVREVLIA